MKEPLFSAIQKDGEDMHAAYALASSTITDFVSLVKSGVRASYMAKLKFKDPDLSEEVGNDQFVFIWLCDVIFHEDSGLLSGAFFEVPQGLGKWHQPGERLGFDSEDAFDWMVIKDGNAKGGFTLRLERSRLASENDRSQFDALVGIKSYE